MKKIILILGIILILISIIGCQNNLNEDLTYTNHNDSNKVDNQIITLDKDITLTSEQCNERNLTDKIIMIESEYCGHCKIARPILEQIAEERDLEIIFLDTSKKEDREKMQNFGISIKYTPTVLINCKVTIGSKEKSEYEAIIDEFLND